jgi:hypothetical protein
LFATLAVGSTAKADRTSWHATASGDVAATDNVFATTRDQSQSDMFATVRPGMLFTYNLPKMVQELTFEGEVLEYLVHSDEPSISFRAGWRGSFTTGKYTSIQTALGASTGVLTALSSRTSPDQTITELSPIGKVDTQQANGSEYFSWNVGRDVRLSQTLFGRASKTDDNVVEDVTMGTGPTIVKSAEVGFALGFERDFRSNSVSLEAGASLLRLERDAPPTAMEGPRLDRQFNPRARVQWRHDFDRQWSSTADGGLVFVYPYGTDPDNPDAELKSGTFPIVGAGLAFSEVWGRAALLVRRDVTPNLFIAQNTVNDSGTLSVAMPLPWLDNSRRRNPKLVGLGSLSVNRTRLIGEDGDLSSSFKIGRLDVGVGYSPRPGFTYGVRYEFVYQTGDAEAVALVPGFFRNTLSFTFNIQYPDRVAGDVPKRRTNSVRADGKDLVPIGVEPVTTEGVGEDSDTGGGDQR